MPNDAPSLIDLFIAFLRLGMTAFGGPSMVAYIRKLAVEKKGWMTARDFGDGVAFCQMVPGATAMQTAAYVGLRLRGASGAMTSFAGFGIPAFCLMVVFAALYARSGSLPQVTAVFSGLQAVVVAIVANAAFSFGRATLKTPHHFLVAGMAAILFWLNFNPLFVLLLAALTGWLAFRRQGAEASRAVAPSRIHLDIKPLAILLVGAGAALAALAVAAPNLLRLALLMSKVDLMAFGGGFASIPIMYHEVVEVNGWLAGPTFMNGIVLGQVTPGPIVITATFIGYLLGQLPGAMVATAAVFLPSLLMVIAVAPFYDRLSRSPVFRAAIQGILASFVGLLLSVALRFVFQVHWDLVHVVLGASALAALLRQVDILWVVLGGVALSLGLIRA